MDEETNKLKIALISGAAHALKYKEENPRATEDEIFQYLSDEAEAILGKIED